MLELIEISKSYGEKRALEQVSLSFSEGVYGLLGPNGAGKSTLMGVITENQKPDGGKVLWDGMEIGKLGISYRKLLGYAPQQQGLYEAFTGRRFLSYMGTLKALGKKELSEEIERVTAYVNLGEVINRPIGTYSGGMKQRLLIAQAIMGDPKLVIMDEPTAGLDPKERVRIREKLRELAKGRMILVATHVVSDIESIAKEIVLLKKGQVMAKDTVEALCKMYGDAEDLEDVYMKVFGDEAEYV